MKRKIMKAIIIEINIIIVKIVIHIIIMVIKQIIIIIIIPIKIIIITKVIITTIGTLIIIKIKKENLRNQKKKKITMRII